MAEITMLVDDLDGSPGAKTVRFSLDGVLYEIDLTLPNAARMRSRLAEFVKAARPVRGRKTKAPSTASKGARLNRTNKDRPPGRPDRRLTSEEAQDVRDWAASQGIELKGRGRIPEYVVNAYYSEKAKTG
jgi:hypothetical protein